MTQESVPGGQLRVGHAEREAVTAILQEAAADGRLGMDELDQRLEVALQAKTYADLEQLVADLSTELPWRSGPGPRPPAVVQGPPAPGYSRGGPAASRGWGEQREARRRLGAAAVPATQLGHGLGEGQLPAGHRRRRR